MNKGIEDFAKGTIFAAGAASLYPTPAGADLPTIFLILLNEDPFTQCPELLTLFRILENKGPVALNEQLKASIRWEMAEDEEKDIRLARLDVTFSSPVKATTSLLLIADNYKPLWKIPAQDNYFVGLVMADEFQSLPATASYADALDLCILMQQPQASGVAQTLEARYNPEKPNTAPPSVFIVDADAADDMQFHCLLLETAFGPRPLLCMTLRGGKTIGPDRGWQASIFEGMGLHRHSEPKTADGWAWSINSNEFKVVTAEGDPFAVFDVSPSDRPWLSLVESSGAVIVAAGEDLVQWDPRTTLVNYRNGIKDGTIAAGVVHSSRISSDEPRTRGTEDEEPAPQSNALVRLWNRLRGKNS